MLPLFTYGTLQHTDVQNKLFQRTLQGTPDVLRGYKLGSIRLPENHPQARSYLIAIYTENPKDQVEGIYYKLSKEEFALADQYEGSAYEQAIVTLASGTKAIVYRKPEHAN